MAAGRPYSGRAGYRQLSDSAQVVEDAVDVAGDVGEGGNRQQEDARGDHQRQAAPEGGMRPLHPGAEASGQASRAPGIQLAADDLRPEGLLTSQGGAFPWSRPLVGHRGPVASARRPPASVPVITSTAVVSRELAVSSDVSSRAARSSRD